MSIHSLRLSPRAAATFWSWLLVGAAILSAPASMLIDNYAAGPNDRFQNGDNPDELIVSAFDLSGIGMTSNGRWATLIGPNTIIAANHYRPTGSVYFYADNNLSGLPVEVGVSSDTLRIGNTDLWLARLDEHVPAAISFFDYATTPISAPTFPFGPGSDFPYKNEPVFMTGRSPGGFAVVQDQAFGTNEISWFVEDDTSAGLGDVDAFRLDYGTNATPHESFIQSGDSGAPLLYDDGSGQLLLLAVNSYASLTGEGDPLASYASYVGNDAALIDLTVAQWAAVPEPASVLLLILAGGMVTVRSRQP
ncbi:MAG: PEP-CTERM sorting domain-containing protein [Akkermansiaceae bacterium]|nr:PEP-CTERM sorting domain-containing protein [Akkermansiaceae bacterium]